jgi:hypothetical protein
MTDKANLERIKKAVNAGTYDVDRLLHRAIIKMIIARQQPSKERPSHQFKSTLHYEVKKDTKN